MGSLDQAITWTYVDLSSLRSSGIHLWIVQEMLNICHKFVFENHMFKLQIYLPEVKELTIQI